MMPLLAMMLALLMMSIDAVVEKITQQTCNKLQKHTYTYVHISSNCASVASISANKKCEVMSIALRNTG